MFENFNTTNRNEGEEKIGDSIDSNATLIAQAEIPDSELENLSSTKEVMRAIGAILATTQ